MPGSASETALRNSGKNEKEENPTRKPIFTTISAIVLILAGFAVAARARETVDRTVLPSRLTHVDYAEVVIPAKQLTVQVHNFNYTDNAPAAAV